ncbi:hypothetical protein [Microbacterium sp. 3J1]|uniref:hypothetical protein n=1 Tax=Microbacterium sp. 3J1 TaxID=861269 RepID=UPI000A9872BF|nr:hypothetical protein [Microbacterium sp. 3J1]
MGEADEEQAARLFLCQRAQRVDALEKLEGALNRVFATDRLHRSRAHEGLQLLANHATDELF